MKFDGKITISSVGARADQTFILITIEDKDASVQLLQVEMDMASFARALTGLGYVPMKYEPGAFQKIGKKMENKTEEVHIPDEVFYKQEDADDAVIALCLSEFEVDGWKGSVRDVKNHHNYVRNFTSPPEQGTILAKGRVFRVSFVRWVDSEQGIANQREIEVAREAKERKDCLAGSKREDIEYRKRHGN